MKLTAVLFAVLIGPSAISAAPAAIPLAAGSVANARACPVGTWLAQHYGISFSGFTTAIPAANPPDMSASGAFVQIKLPDPVHVSDGFHHVAYLDKTTQKAWILRTGGFIGVYEWYGPVDTDTTALNDCMPRASTSSHHG